MTLAAGHVAVDPQLVRGHLRGHGVAPRAEAFRLAEFLEGGAADRRHGAEPPHDEQRDEEAAAGGRWTQDPSGNRADAPAGRPREPSGDLADASAGRPRGLTRRGFPPTRHGIRLAWQAIRLIGSIRQP